MPFNVRDLTGALRRLIANAEYESVPITLDFTKDVLQDLIILQEKIVSIMTIQKTVSTYFNLNIDELLSETKIQSIARPRQIAMRLARELTPHSFPEIGLAFNGRNHTTIMSACKKIDDLKKIDLKLSDDYINLIRILSA